LITPFFFLFPSLRGESSLALFLFLEYPDGQREGTQLTGLQTSCRSPFSFFFSFNGMGPFSFNSQRYREYIFRENFRLPLSFPFSPFPLVVGEFNNFFLSAIQSEHHIPF